MTQTQYGYDTDRMPQPLYDPEPPKPAKRGVSVLKLFLVVGLWLFSLLVAFELGHWAGEGYPPLIPHLLEGWHHLSGLLGHDVGKYLW